MKFQSRSISYHAKRVFLHQFLCFEFELVINDIYFINSFSDIKPTYVTVSRQLAKQQQLKKSIKRYFITDFLQNLLSLQTKHRPFKNLLCIAFLLIFLFLMYLLAIQNEIKKRNSATITVVCFPLLIITLQMGYSSYFFKPKGYLILQ